MPSLEYVKESFERYGRAAAAALAKNVSCVLITTILLNLLLPSER